MVRKSKPPSYRRFKVYIVSVVLGAIASGTALILFSLLVFILRLPVTQSGIFSLLAFGIGCLVAGFTAGAMKRQGGLGAGIRAALLFTVPVIVIGFVLGGFASEATPAVAEAADAAREGAPPAAITGVSSLNRIIIAILCGAIGGVFGVNKNGGF